MASAIYSSPSNNTTQVPSEELAVELRGFISYEQRVQIEFALGLIMQVLNFTALVANGFNIAVFIKLGFAETSNITLLVLSLSDFTATVASVWTCICDVPAFKNLDLPFNPDTIIIYFGTGPWGFVIRFGAWITAYITFERCLCIIIPLKVKSLITTKSTVIIVSIIAVVTLGGMSVNYILWTHERIYYPELNRTILEIVRVHKPGYDTAYVVMHYLYGMLLVFLAFAIVAVCTAFLVIHLRRSSQWRKSATSGQATHSQSSGDSKAASKKSISTKEERLVKMVVSIAAVFIVCFTPNAVYHLCIALYPEFALFGRYRNTLAVTFMITSILQSISATANIFIYYKMGSRFRNAFREMLRLDKKDKT